MKYRLTIGGRIATTNTGEIRYFNDREEVESLAARFGGEVLEGEGVTLEQVMKELIFIRGLVEQLVEKKHDVSQTRTTKFSAD